jgi:hypothetical protein
VGRIVNQICDEHLGVLDAESIGHLIVVLTALSRQSVDVNTALTATATLWTITDVVGRVMTAARRSGRVHVVPMEQPVLAGQPMDLVWDLWRVLAVCLCGVVCTDKKSDAAAAPASLPGLELLSSRTALEATTAIRHDVRNAAVQTLFNSLSSHGSTMPSAVLQELLVAVCLPLAYDVTLRANWYASSQWKHFAAAPTPGVGSPGISVRGEVLGVVDGQAVHARVHHSGDTLLKQWNEARIMALQGLTKVLAACFDRVVVLGWFHDVFSFVLALVERAVTGRSMGHVRSGARTASIASTEEHHGSPPPIADSSEAPTSWWDFLVGDGDDDAVAASESGESTPSLGASRQAASLSSTAEPSILLEPPTVSVAAIACLQELALLVCVPAGVAVDAAQDGYAVGMRVVDGALVQTDSTAESDAARGRSPVGIAVDVSASGTQGDDQNMARSVLWADVFATLTAVMESKAIVAEGADKVAVAAVTCVQQLLVAHSSAPVFRSQSEVRPDTFLLSARFSTVLCMLYTVAQRRLHGRWARANAPKPGEEDEDAIAEDLVAPRVEVAVGSERAIIKALEKVAHVLHLHCLALWGGGAQGTSTPSALLTAADGEGDSTQGKVVQQAVCEACSVYLSTLVMLACLREKQCHPPLRGMGDVAIVPGALQTAALSQLQAMLRNVLKPYFPRPVREGLSRPLLLLLSSASKWYRRLLQQLQDNLQSHADQSAGACSAAPPTLQEIMQSMGKSPADFQMSFGANAGSSHNQLLFPLQVWGMGAGGSYSTQHAIISDARMAQRMAAKVKTHDGMVSGCLLCFGQWAGEGPGLADVLAADSVRQATARMHSTIQAWIGEIHPVLVGLNVGDDDASARRGSVVRSRRETESSLQTDSAQQTCSLQSLQDMLGVPSAINCAAAAVSLMSGASARSNSPLLADRRQGGMVGTVPVAALLVGEIPQGVDDPTIGMSVSAVSNTLLRAKQANDGVTADEVWQLLYVLAAASLVPAGALSGLPLSQQQLSAAMSCFVGLSRLVALSSADGRARTGLAAPARAAAVLAVDRACLFVACGLFSCDEVLTVVIAAMKEVRHPLGAICQGFSLLALLLNASVTPSSVAVLAGELERAAGEAP